MAPALSEVEALYAQIEKLKNDPLRVEKLTATIDLKGRQDHLAYILTRFKGKEGRQSAGILLEMCIKTTMDASDYVKSELIDIAFNSPNENSECEFANLSVGLINMIRGTGVSGWPKLIESMMDDSNFVIRTNLERAAPVFLDIYKDDKDALLREIEVFPFLLNYHTHRVEPTVNKELANLLMKYAEIDGQVVLHEAEDYISFLKDCTQLDDQEVQNMVVSQFAQLQELSAVQLQNSRIIPSIIKLSRSPSSSVKLNVAKFWLSYWWRSTSDIQLLDIFLSSILSALVEYLEHTAERNLPENGELRRCSASALKLMLIPSLGDSVCTNFLAIVKPLLTSTAWEKKEAAAFILGEMADNIIDVNDSDLFEMIESILKLLEDEDTLVRSTACSALSSYSKFLVSSEDDQLMKFFESLLQKLIDDDDGVRRSACHAVLCFQEVASCNGKNKLASHVKTILQHVMAALKKDQSGLTLLCQIIKKLYEDFDEAVKYEDLLTKIVSKWKEVLISKKDQYLLLECYDILDMGLKRVTKLWKLVVGTCISTIEPRFEAKDDVVVVRSLDLLCACEYLSKPSVKREFERLSPDLILKCCEYKGLTKVRTSAFLLLGHIGNSHPTYMVSHIEKIYAVATDALDMKKKMTDEDISVAISACTAIAKITEKVNSPIYSKATLDMFLSLIYILNESTLKSLSGPGHLLRDLSAIALGKLICAHPVYAYRLPRFINVWCLALSRITDPEQKLNALRALWVVVDSKRSIHELRQLNSLSAIFLYLSTLEVPSKEESWDIGWMVNGIRKKLKKNVFQKAMSGMENSTSKTLLEYEEFFLKGPINDV